MSTEKAVILAGGIGRRMRTTHPSGVRLTEEAELMAGLGLKGLIPLRGRPFLDYVVGSLIRAGPRRICLVVPPDNDVLTHYVREAAELTGVEVCCAVQRQPLGTADALLAAEGFVGSDGFIMANCDNLYPLEALSRLARLGDHICWVAAFESGALVREGNFAAERVRVFSAVVVGPGGELEQIVEKPPEPERYARDGKLWVNMNLFRLTPEVFDSCRSIQPHPERGELELPTAIGHLVQSRRVPFRVMFSGGGVLDLTTRGDVASAEMLVDDAMPGFERPDA